MEELERAVTKVSRSDKGRQAMRGLLAFLENGGISLEADNHGTSFTCLRALRKRILRRTIGKSSKATGNEGARVRFAIP